MRPHMITLRNFDGTIFSIMTSFTSTGTKFHSNRPKNIEILEGGGGGAWETSKLHIITFF